MPEPKVIVAERRDRKVVLPPEPAAAWGWIGWLGLALAVAGLGDTLLAWYPTAFGTPEWEFATVVQTFSALPLVTMGFAGMLGAGLALGKRWLIVMMGIVLLASTLSLIGALLLFMTDVPLALRAAQGVAEVGVKKAIGKTVLLGVIFVVAYGGGAIAALRHAARK